MERFPFVRFILLAFCLLAPFAKRSPAEPTGETFRFTRQRYDAMVRQLDDARDVGKLDGSRIAWGEGYVLRSYLEMFQATDDRGYLRRFVKLADAVLSRRDDARGLADHAGRVLPLWGVGGRYTVAAATLTDEKGRPALAVKSVRYAYNDQTQVSVSPGTAPGTWKLSHWNPYWAKYGPARRTFDNLSLDPAAPRYVEKVVDDPDFVPAPHFFRRLDESPSFLLVVTDLRKQAPPADKGLRTVTGVALVPRRLAYPGYIGPICSPLTRFAWLIHEDGRLRPEFATSARRYVEAAEQSLAAWAPCWRDGPHNGEGYYLLTAKGEPFWCDGIGAPFNYLCSAGQVLLYLHAITGRPGFLRKATAVALLFKHRLQRLGNGAYQWDYWWGPGEAGWTKADDLSVNTPARGPARYVEDISHGAWEVEFAVLAHRFGVVFSRDDMTRFTATFTKSVWVPADNDLTDRVDGNRKAKGTYNIAGGRWLELTDFDPAVFTVMQRIFAAHRYDHGCHGQLAEVYARLVRWQVRLQGDGIASKLNETR